MLLNTNKDCAETRISNYSCATVIRKQCIASTGVQFHPQQFARLVLAKFTLPQQ